MNKVVKFFKKILYLPLIIVSLILVWQAIIYILSPIYDFLPPVSFNGNNIYNPYQNTDSSNWLKGNFHLHSNAWSFFTDGRKNDKDSVLKKYKSLGYNLISLSDYQKISKFNHSNCNLITAYEHGFNINKTHQLSLGAKNVLWKDYIFYQDINHKQNIIYSLKENCNVLCLNHPRMMNSYTPDELKLLRGYQLFEAMNHLRFSIDLWDTVLSAGIPAFILANDDCHDIFNPTLFGRCCTFIQSSVYNSDSILTNLQKGIAYGVELAMPSDDINDNIKYHQNIPKLHNVELIGDTLMRVVTDRHARKFYFYGQNGTLKDSVFNTNIAEYVFKKTDTYIRTEIFFSDNTRLLLNPLFRYKSKDVFSKTNPINLKATTIKRSIYFCLLTLFITLFVFIKKKKSKATKTKTSSSNKNSD